MWHELSHCYCERNHDYRGKKYDEGKAASSKGSGDSFYDNGCPRSIMYPIIVEDNCAWTYYDEYVQEMFENCVRY